MLKSIFSEREWVSERLFKNKKKKKIYMRASTRKYIETIIDRVSYWMVESLMGIFWQGATLNPRMIHCKKGRITDKRLFEFNKILIERAHIWISFFLFFVFFLQQQQCFKHSHATNLSLTQITGTLWQWVEIALQMF